MSKREPHPNDWAYIDDATSLLIIGSGLLVVLATLGTLAYLVASGRIATDIAVTGDVVVRGTIPLGTVFLGLGALLAYLVIVAVRDIYGGAPGRGRPRPARGRPRGVT